MIWSIKTRSSTKTHATKNFAPWKMYDEYGPQFSFIFDNINLCGVSEVRYNRLLELISIFADKCRRLSTGNHTQCVLRLVLAPPWSLVLLSSENSMKTRDLTDDSLFLSPVSVLSVRTNWNYMHLHTVILH